MRAEDGEVVAKAIVIRLYIQTEGEDERALFVLVEGQKRQAVYRVLPELPIGEEKVS